MKKNQLSRIMIFGRPGSGKSTFAVKLAKALNLPVHHLDRHFFEANWVERPYQEFLDIQKSIVTKDRWIVDGNSIQSLEMRYQRADLVLYFNYPRWICIWRLLKRRFNKNPHIQDRAASCSEALRWSLLSYMWTFETRVEQPISILKARYPHVRMIEIRSNQELEKLKKELIKDKRRKHEHPL